jgi:hypothetical protein
MLGYLKKIITGHWFFILFSACCVLPFCILSAFNHPSADDFNITYGIIEKGFWVAQVDWYLGWTGRFGSTALLSFMHPLLYKSFFLYRLYPILFLLITWVALYHLSRNLFLSQTKGFCLATSGISLITMICILPSMVEGFFWVPGLFIYMLGNIFTIFFASYLLAYERTLKKSYYWLAILFGIMAIGSNEESLLIIMFIVGIWGLGKLIGNKKSFFKSSITIVFLSITAAFSLFAPGNKARGEVIETTSEIKELMIHDFVFALQRSLSHGTSDLINWIFFGPLVLLTLLTLMLHQKLGLRIKPILHPIIIWIGILGIFFLLYFPYYYGTGSPYPQFFPKRTSNVISFYLCFALLIGILYTLHWAKKIKNINVSIPSSPRLIGFVSVGLILIILTTGNVKNALKDLRSRDFIAYDQELNARYEQIANTSSDTIIVDSLHFFPRTLYFDDLSSEPENWKNVPYAAYFGKRVIRLKNAQDELK